MSGWLGSAPAALDPLQDKVDFVREGWSLKRLVREMVLSKTFRQASERSEAASRIDPENRLLSHMSVRRLEAEAVSVVLDDAAIEPLDQRLDTAARFPRRPRKPPGEIHVVFPFQLPEVAFEDLQFPFDLFRFGHYLGIKNQINGSQSSRA